jgi:hypothetical protein
VFPQFEPKPPEPAIPAVLDAGMRKPPSSHQGVSGSGGSQTGFAAATRTGSSCAVTELGLS